MSLWATFLSIIMVSTSTYALNDVEREAMEQRISPVGAVHIQEEANPSGKPASLNSSKQETKIVQKITGQQTYEQYCIVCHQDGLAGAPKFRTQADWKVRLSKSNLDALADIAMTGLNAMPPKGTCTECTKEDLKAAIEYMVPK